MIFINDSKKTTHTISGEDQIYTVVDSISHYPVGGDFEVLLIKLNEVEGLNEVKKSHTHNYAESQGGSLFGLTNPVLLNGVTCWVKSTRRESSIF